MPHVIVKLWPGKSEEQKTRLAERITKDVIDVLNYGEESVSVSLEEVSPQDWVEKGLNLTVHIGPKGLQADGADAALIDFAVVNGQGRRCPTDEARVDFAVSGAARE